MSQHQSFRRVSVNQQVATKQETVTFPAPTRGLIMNENDSYMQPGAAVVLDNWKPTMKGAAVRGGFTQWANLSAITPATFDPATVTNVTLSGGNLVATSTGGSSGDQGAKVATALGKSTGKYYFEVTLTNLVGTGFNECFGVGTTTSTYFNIGQGPAIVGCTVGPRNTNCQTFVNGVNAKWILGTRSNGDVIGMAVDLDHNKVWFRVAPSGPWNGTWDGLPTFPDPGPQNPATNTGGIDIPDGTMVPFCAFSVSGVVFTANFGATSFVSAVPSGFTAGWGTLAPDEPIISAFNYISGDNQRMYFANATKVYDVTTSTPVLVKSGQTDGNYSTAQMDNQAGDFLIAVNDTGNYPLRFDGTTWTTLNASQITASTSTYPGNVVSDGSNLVHVCKYRNRLFFIEINSMNAWYLPINAIQGALNLIPLSGAATKGGKLVYCATWSIDAGDGIDDKLVFGTDLGEILVFTGSDPSVAANWKQEGRYDMSPPLGKNATLTIGGDLLVACVDGILPTSGAITKDKAELELAAITRAIKPMWRTEMLSKRAKHWSMCKWDEYGGIFVAAPGGVVGDQHCFVVNAATGAWARFTGWDCTCYTKLRGVMYFGTQAGKVMQADNSGYDNGAPYTATLVSGWEVFQSPSQTITWKQARATFTANPGETFQPLLSGTTDYVVTLPTPPLAAPAPAGGSLWDQGLWDSALWDTGVASAAVVRNTGWVSIGITGFSHAQVVQITIAQTAKPEIELISTAGVFERLAVTV